MGESGLKDGNLARSSGGYLIWGYQSECHSEICRKDLKKHCVISKKV